MCKTVSILFIILNFNSFSQKIEIMNRSVFKIDSIEFNIARINYLKQIEEPYVRGGDAKFARNSQIFFKLKNSSSIFFSIGDSLYIEEVLLSKRNQTDYYLFSDIITNNEGRLVYTYSLIGNSKSDKYHIILSSIYLKNKKYFVLINVDSKGMKYAFNLIDDLQSFD